MTILFLEAIAPWLEGPARGLAQHVPVTALQHVSMRAQRSLGLDRERIEGDFTYRTRVFPPGFAGAMAPLFAPLIRGGVKRIFAAMEPHEGIAPQVICPFPYAEPWVRDIPGDQLTYYNVDDYALYDEGKRAQITRQEDLLVRKARVTICVARHQAEALRARQPDRAASIHHLPHGLAEDMLNPHPEEAPRSNIVGYVGNLSDRVDWTFVDAVAELVPELTFEFVGHANPNNSEWAKARAKVFGRNNVRFLGPVPQAEVAPHYWHSAVNWMPYDVAHPFNIASSPTKIFDAFGAGRPFVSTAIPEVSCHPDRIAIVHSPEQAAEMLRDACASFDPAKAVALRDFARGHVWQRRAVDILDLLGQAPQAADNGNW